MKLVFTKVNPLDLVWLWQLMEKKQAATETDSARSAKAGAEYRDSYKIVTGYEITAGAVENGMQDCESGTMGNLL